MHTTTEIYPTQIWKIYEQQKNTTLKRKGNKYIDKRTHTKRTEPELFIFAYSVSLCTMSHLRFTHFPQNLGKDKPRQKIRDGKPSCLPPNRLFTRGNVPKAPSTTQVSSCIQIPALIRVYSLSFLKAIFLVTKSSFLKSSSQQVSSIQKPPSWELPIPTGRRFHFSIHTSFLFKRRSSSNVYFFSDPLLFEDLVLLWIMFSLNLCR